MKYRLLPLGLIGLSGLLVYLNALHNGFHLDDYYRLVGNPGIESFWPPWRHFFDPRTMSSLDRLVQYRPLLPLMLSINHALFGDNLVAYHLGNLLSHLGAAALLYCLCFEWLVHWSKRDRSLSSSAGIALVVAVLFVVHPVSGIPVNYITARDLILMQLFLLASLLAYTRMRRLGPTSWRWALILICLALSILSKTNAAILPLVVLFFELTLGRESVASKRLWQRVLPFAGVVVLYFGLTRYGLGFSAIDQIVDDGSGFWDYALTQMELHLSHYAYNFVWPFYIRQLPAVEGANSLFDAGVFSGLLFIAGSLVTAWKVRQRTPLLSFAIVAYWTLQIPASSILPLHQLAVDYRPYPASPFLFLGLTLVGRECMAGKAMRMGFASAIVLSLGAASFYMNRTWRTDETLWTHSVKYGGDCTAHLNLAMSLADQRDQRVRHHLEEPCGSALTIV